VPSYQLTNAADEDLVELYTYSFLEFGEHRAEAYFELLEDCLQRLAANPQLGVGVTGLRRDYYRFVHQRHSIYYKKSRSGILVVRILGPGMSAERNLP
jgi:toxin ParE1/3/4